jgi:hypothetical protein
VPANVSRALATWKPTFTRMLGSPVIVGIGVTIAVGALAGLIWLIVRAINASLNSNRPPEPRPPAW